MRVTVCVPRSAPLAKREQDRAHGARSSSSPPSDHYDDAEALAKELAATQGAAFLSPYDDVDVVLGNGVSLGFEIVRALGGVPERVLAPFGGGGLATGLSWAMQAESDDPSDRSVWGVQREASCAMAMSLERGAAVERLETGGTTLAEGLEGGISVDGFARARAAVAGVVVVTEAQIAAGDGARAPRHGPGARGERRDGAGAGALRPARAAARGGRARRPHGAERRTRERLDALDARLARATHGVLHATCSAW